MWSKYQEAVFLEAATGDGNAAVEAVAGSGKTTTGMEMVQRLNPVLCGLFTSFTRATVEDAARKIKERRIQNVEAKTYNSFGARLIYRNMRQKPTLLTDYPGQKTDTILMHQFEQPNTKDYFKSRNTVIRLVSMFKSLAIMSPDEAERRYTAILDYYDIEEPDVKGFKDLVLTVFARSLERTDIIDFDDQKFFPVYFGWEFPQVDFLVIDEYQDTCPIESELMLRACRHGRVFIFGDRYQAIYAFKGTKPDAMQSFIDDYSATELPLSICYRCPRLVVNEAQRIVPHIESFSDAIDGTVDTVENHEQLKRVRDGDMVLARTTDDLVNNVMSLIADGRPAYVEGVEYGNQLHDLIDKLTKKENLTIAEFDFKLSEYFNELYPELLRKNQERKAILLESKKRCLDILSTGCRDIQDLGKKINSVFTDRGRGVRHLTAHKSKGLESGKDGDVYILDPKKFPHPSVKMPHLIEEEKRLLYVAITRAQRGLYYTLAPPKE